MAKSLVVWLGIPVLGWSLFIGGIVGVVVLL